MTPATCNYLTTQDGKGQGKSLNLPSGSLPDSENSLQSGDYLDYLHKSHNFLTPHCKKYFRYGECENGHQFIKVMGCGKEWCPDCSPQRHKQRIARLWPKIYKMEAAGYLIFTIPEEMREVFKYSERLDAIQKFIHRWLDRQFPGWRGFSRWHFFGKKDKEKYHPHLNVLIDQGWISGDVLARLKKLYRRELERISGIKVNKKVDVRYRYIENKGDKTVYWRKLYHRLKYITRPTFLVYQKDLAIKLKGYRNIRLHGWKKKTSEDEEESFKILEEITGIARLYEARLLHKSICPFCKAKVKWEDKVYSPRTLFLLFEDAFWVGDCGESFFYLGHKDDEVIQGVLVKIFEFLERERGKGRGKGYECSNN